MPINEADILGLLQQTLANRGNLQPLAPPGQAPAGPSTSPRIEDLLGQPPTLGAAQAEKAHPFQDLLAGIADAFSMNASVLAGSPLPPSALDSLRQRREGVRNREERKRLTDYQIKKEEFDRQERLRERAAEGDSKAQSELRRQQERKEDLSREDEKNAEFARRFDATEQRLARGHAESIEELRVRHFNEMAENKAKYGEEEAAKIRKEQESGLKQVRANIISQSSDMVAAVKAGEQTPEQIRAKVEQMLDVLDLQGSARSMALEYFDAKVAPELKKANEDAAPARRFRQKRMGETEKSKQMRGEAKPPAVSKL